MKTSSLAGSVAVLVSLAACSPPATTPPPAPDAVAIKTALDKEIAKFVPIMNSKDPAALAAVFTPDATWILPDASTFMGTAAITAGAKAFFDSMESFVAESAVIDKLVVVSDTEAVTFSHGLSMLKMKGMKQAEHHNNPFADHWKKRATGWQVDYEINADGSVPPTKP